MVARLRPMDVAALAFVVVALATGAYGGDLPIVPAANPGPGGSGGPLDPYTPPACTGLFADVACPGGFAVNWIEKFDLDGITAGCGSNPLVYCPDSPVTRAQMAVFVGKAMRGTATWTPTNVTPDLMRAAMLNWWGGPYSGGSYGFNGPSGVAFDGIHIWVANEGGNSVTELNASNGAWVRTLSGSPFGFNAPRGMAFEGDQIWVGNFFGGSVTEIYAADGSWVRTLSGGS